MEEFLYLEADEEITSVIDKLKGLESKSVGLVAPKGSMIAQSLVSLKLLQKEAKKFDKKIALVTSDEVGRNLAAQVGLSVYADVKSSKPLEIQSEPDGFSKEPIEIDMRGDDAKTEKKAETGTRENAENEPQTEEKLPKDFTLHRYDEEESGEGAEEDENIAKETVKESAQESSISKSAKSYEPEPEVESRPIVEHRAGPEDEEKFVKRPVGDLKDYVKRQEIEDSRPIRHQDFKSSHTEKKRGKIKPVLLVVLGVFVFIGLVGLADLVFAKLTVTLQVAADPIEKEVEIKVEKDKPQIDADAGIIPGVLVTKERNVETSVEATGEKDMGEKAKGIIAFKNESGVDETILAGSSIKSSSSIEFTLDSNITVPKATLNSSGDKVLGQVSGAITAKTAGAQGNMSSSITYAIVGKSKITASGATSGGVTKTVKIVTKSDIERGKRELQNKNSDSIIEEAKNDKENIVLDDAGTLEVSDYEASKNANDEADTFVAKGKLRYTALAFSSKNLEEVSIKQVEKTLEQNKGLVTTDSDEITPTIKEAQLNVGTLKINSKVKSHVGPKLDLKEQTMAWRGKPVKKIKEIVGSLEGVKVQAIDLSPQWALPVAPIINNNIKVNVEYSPDSNSST